MQAEERELANRQNGSLRKLLGEPLPDESSEEIKRIAEEDRLRALEGSWKCWAQTGKLPTST